mmetsp:Transcript_11236/g.28345  ORF Transcript_11236/g.28345 Transcript_11236/m.28345 type:complete len:997 (-) Transcript_11236:158-3148(-)
MGAGLGVEAHSDESPQPKQLDSRVKALLKKSCKHRKLRLQFSSESYVGTPSQLPRGIRKIYLDFNKLSTLPEPLEELPFLTTLSAHGNHLSHLPRINTPCPQLAKLNLGRNELHKAPENWESFLSRLSGLEALDLSWNRLCEVTIDLSCLSILSTLEFAGNGLLTAPSDIGKLAYLTHLDLSQNRLGRLPDELCAIKNLNVLKVKDNLLTALPSQIGDLQGLIELDVSSNQLSSLPLGMRSLGQLSTVNLERNFFSVVPAVCAAWKQVVTLNLSECTMDFKSHAEKRGDEKKKNQQLAVMVRKKRHSRCDSSEPETEAPLSRCISTISFNNLTVMNLSKNNFLVLPQELSLMTRLEVLDLSENRLLEVPADFVGFTRLVHLNLSRNLLSTEGVGNIFVRMRTLQYLNLGCNLLQSVPKHIVKLSSLHYLNLFNNRITCLPAELSFCKHLFAKPANFYGTEERRSYLNLSYNCLTEFPVIACHFENLEELILDGNAFDEISVFITQMKRLYRLSMCNMDRELRLPPTIDNLSNLRRMHVCGPHPVYLPKLTNLKLHVLDVGYNSVLTEASSLNSFSHILVQQARPSNSTVNIPSLVPTSKSIPQTLSATGISENFASLGTQSPNVSVINCIDFMADGEDEGNGLEKISAVPALRVEKPSQDLSPTSSPRNEVLIKSPRNHSSPVTKEKSNWFLLKSSADEKDEKQDPRSSPTKLGSIPKGGIGLLFASAKMSGENNENEDMIVTRTPISSAQHLKHIDYFGLFDGHGGPMASIFCASNLHEILMEMYTPERIRENPVKFFTTLIVEMNMQMKKHFLKKADWDMCGTTASIVLIDRANRTIYVSNVGDSQCVLGTKTAPRGKQAKLLTESHTLENPDEFNSAIQRGAMLTVFKKRYHIVCPHTDSTFYHLHLSRSLGDFFLPRVISVEPSVQVHPLTGTESVMVLASAGVWSVMNEEEVTQLALTETDPVKAAIKIRDFAYSLGSQEDISCVVVFFEF